MPTKHLFATYADKCEIDIIKNRMRFCGLDVSNISVVPFWERLLSLFDRTWRYMIPRYAIETYCTTDEWLKYVETWNDLAMVNLAEEET